MQDFCAAFIRSRVGSAKEINFFHSFNDSNGPSLSEAEGRVETLA